MRSAAKLGIVFGLVMGGLAVADDAVVKAQYEKALALFKERATAGKIDEAIAIVEPAAAQAQDTELKYDVILLHSRCLYWKGMHTQGDKAKQAIHDAGYKVAETARKLDLDYAEAYYFSAVQLIRWGEATGIAAALGKKKEIVALLEGTIDRNTKNGDPGEGFEGWGAHRAFGRLYFKLPGFAGGDLGKSLIHLDKAFSNAKHFAINVNFYAESLAANKEKPKALQILDELLASDPQTLNPDRIPETLDELEATRKLKAEIGG